MILLNTLSKLITVKETEKALAVKGWANYEGSSKSWEIAIWIPKSIIKDGIIPEWFLRNKENDYRGDGLNVVMEIA